MIDDRNEAGIESPVDEPEVTLAGPEVVGLYVHLSSQEARLGPDMVGILDRIEKELFRCLTIEQIEQIESPASDEDRPRGIGAAEKE